MIIKRTVRCCHFETKSKRIFS